MKDTVSSYLESAVPGDNPCVSYLCWLKAQPGKAYCAWHEVVYIAKHDRPSPPIANDDDWRKELFSPATEERGDGW